MSLPPPASLSLVPAQGQPLLIVQILCRNQPVNHGPFLPGAQPGAGEHHTVEGHVVLGHELPVLNILRVLPPLLPVLCVLGGDADVPDGGVKPDVNTSSWQ